jgi:tetratricopeptide (TPR) repeat protein
VAGERESDPPPASLSGRAEWKALRAATKVTPMLLARLRPPTALALRSLGSPNNRGAFNVVHFIGHGLPGALALEDERGLMKLVSAIELAAALKEGEIQLAVINTCYSAAGDERSIAQALVDAGVRSVVAHREPLIDPAAVLFSQALYRELAAGRSLRAAFDEAVQETTAHYAEEKGNAALLGDEGLRFARSGNEEPSRVIEGAALPDEAARFFGRGHELIELADIFAHPDLRGAALTGIGGIGKSALAFEAADRLAWRFDDRVAYVRAVEFGFKAEDALSELARGLKIEVRGHVASELRDYVNREPCLLLFDNMERAGGELYRLAEFVSSLNMDAGSKVLFTLRPPLNEKFHEVREMNLHTGLDGRAALDYVRTTAYNLNAAPQWQNVDEARALIQRVNGHPEVMRLAIYRSLKTPYARVKQEVAALSGKLNEALSDLIGKQVAQAGEVAQTALARLTIFPQPRMIVEAAQAACGDAADGLDALVENGVIALEQDDVQRYGLHPTALDYARGKMHEAGLLQEARQHAVKAYSELADAHANEYDLYASEHDNYMAAMEWAWSSEMWAEVASMAQGAVGYLRMKGYWQDGFNWMKRAVEARRKLPDSNENKKQLACHLDSLARFYHDFGDMDAALSCFEESRRLLEASAYQKGLATTLHEMARISVTRGDLDGALALYQQSLDAAKQLGDLKIQSDAMSNMANVLVTRGDLDGAMQLYQQSLDIKERLGDLQGKSATLHAMANVLVTRGDLDGALALYQQSLDIKERLGNLQGKSATLGQMSDIFMKKQQWDNAKRVLTEAVEIEKRIGDATVGYEIAKLGQIAEHDMDFEEAARLYKESIGYFEKLGSPVAEQVRQMLARVLQRIEKAT